MAIPKKTGYSSLELDRRFDFVVKTMWWIYAILSASLTAIFAKLGVAGMNSNLATGIRTVIVLIMIWSIVLVRGEAKGIDSLLKQGIAFLIISEIATGLSWLFYFKALQSGNVSQVATIDKLSVVLTILLAIIFLGESLTLKTVIGAWFDYCRDFGNDCKMSCEGMREMLHFFCFFLFLIFLKNYYY